MDSIAVDLYCGLGGWAEGFLAENFTVIGFDIERHDYGTGGYPGQLVLQDVLTLHGSQFKDAAVIVASPPCTEYSYMAMPWKRAKQIARALRGQDEFPKDYRGSRTVADLNALFDACFRIQREASEAAGRHIPLIVENVRGAQPWVGRSAWNFGSYHLWGDVPALMPIPFKAQKFNPDGTAHPAGSWFAIADSQNRGQKVPGFRFDGNGGSFQSASVKVAGQDWGRFAKTGEVSPHWRMQAAKDDDVGNKMGGDWFSDPTSTCRKHGSKSKARKAASAQIARIPFPLAHHIAKCFASSPALTAAQSRC